MDQENQLRGVLIVTIGVLILTPDGLLIRLLSTDSWTTLFMRGLISGPTILLGYWLVAKQNPIQQIKSQGRFGFTCAVIFALGSICFILSINNTTVANTLFIASTAPIFAAIMSRFFLNEYVPRRIWYAILVALLGIGIIATGSLGHGQSSLIGDLFALGAAICMAGALSLIRHARARSMVPTIGLSGLILAAITLLPASLMSIQATDWIYLALLGLIVVPIPFSLIAIGPRYLPASEVSLLLLLEAVLGPLWVWLVLGEFPGWLALTGGAIVIVTLIAMNIYVLRQEIRQQGK
jgi:drug/metabolite transporter (DMT)-like permease